jgi:hypothetical protein
MHDLAVVTFQAGRFADAVPLAFNAYQLYEDSHQRTRALSDVGVFLKELGHYSEAKQAFLVVLDGQCSGELRINVELELLELSAIIQDRVGFERWRRIVDAKVDQLPPDLAVEFNIKLGIGLAAFGNKADAMNRLNRAIALAEEYRLGQRIFEAEEHVREIKEGDSTPKALSPRPRELDTTPEFIDAIEGLYALSAGVA